MNYAEFKARQSELEFAIREIGARLNAYPKAVNGLTLDSGKDANWLPLKAEQAKLFKRYRDFNGQFCPQFQKEIIADRDARREALRA